MVKGIKAFLRPIVTRALASLSPNQRYRMAIRILHRLPPNQLSPDQSQYLFHVAADVHRKHLHDEIKQATGRIIQNGPFKGMKLPDQSSWGDGADVAKLLGFYEAELHMIFYDLLERNYDSCINIGCAEGYYAVGCALLSKTAQIFAFDTSLDAQKLCRICAEENNVFDRVQIGGSVDPSTLQSLLSKWKKPLLIVDCEGCESHLMQPDLVPALKNTAFIVECHNFIHPNITRILVERFSETHKIRRIAEGQRNPNCSTFLRNRHSLIRWLAVSENRPESMEWLLGVPLGAG
jgi:hypothetical protein